MREEIEVIINSYLFELFNHETRSRIKSDLTLFLLGLQERHVLLNFHIEDLTTPLNVENGLINLNIIYQYPHRFPMTLSVITIIGNEQVKIEFSDFKENNVGKKEILPLKF